MINLNNQWNFKEDNIKWRDIVEKTFPTFSTQNKKYAFDYPLSPDWDAKTIFLPKDKNKIQKLGFFGQHISSSQAKFFSIDKIFKATDFNKVHLNSYEYNKMGLDGRWEVSFALYDLVQLWKKNKLPKNISVLSSVDENIFYQVAKNLAYQKVLTHLLSILKLKSKVAFSLMVSDRMYNGTDCKNNLIRLSYAVFSSLIIKPDFFILTPVVGLNKDQQWKLACQAYNVMKLETDITHFESPYAGTVFFEKTVSSISQSMWEGLQYLLKLDSEKAVKAFFNKSIIDRKIELESLIEQRKIKVVGVNEFISPQAKIIKSNNVSDVKFFEIRRLKYISDFAKILKNVSFKFIGEKIKLSKKLNEVYQLFAMLNIMVDWKKEDVFQAKSIHSCHVLVVGNIHEVEKLLTQWQKNTKPILIFSEENIFVIKNKKTSKLIYNSNPIVLWTELAEVLK